MYTLPFAGAEVPHLRNSGEGRENRPKGRCDCCHDGEEGRIVYEAASLLSVI